MSLLNRRPMIAATDDPLPGLRRALHLCKLVDRRQARDGLIREAVDCSEVIQREIASLEYRNKQRESDNSPD